jgi:hypothetical protein
MIIKKFESFSSDEPYIKINYVDFISETKKGDPFENIELLKIIKGLRLESKVKLYYHDSDIIGEEIGYIFSKNNIDEKIRLDRKISQISFYKKYDFVIIKGEDEYIYLSYRFKFYKCDELSGLIELLKDLEIWKDPKS